MPLLPMPVRMPTCSKLCLSTEIPGIHFIKVLRAQRVNFYANVTTNFNWIDIIRSQFYKFVPVTTIQCRFLCKTETWLDHGISPKGGRIFERFGWWAHNVFVRCFCVASLIASVMGPTWGPSGADMTQVGLMLAPWILLSGMLLRLISS